MQESTFPRDCNTTVLSLLHARPRSKIKKDTAPGCHVLWQPGTYKVGGDTSLLQTVSFISSSAFCRGSASMLKLKGFFHSLHIITHWAVDQAGSSWDIQFPEHVRSHQGANPYRKQNQQEIAITHHVPFLQMVNPFKSHIWEMENQCLEQKSLSLGKDKFHLFLWFETEFLDCSSLCNLQLAQLWLFLHIFS